MTRPARLALPLALPAALVTLLAVAPAPARAGETGAETQPRPLPHRWVEVAIDSGEVAAPAGESAAPAWTETVEVEGATWLRLFFDQAALGAVPGRGGEGAVVRVTSLADGAVQHLDARSLAEWRRSTAFFNGDSVKVELIAPPGAAASRLAIREVMAGEPAAIEETICFATDDRTASFDNRSARVVPVGCSVWLIDDAHGCFLTAGHCVTSTFDVVEFNVPLSNPNGTVNHPPPADQYPVDPASVQSINGGVGNDWGYFGVHPNSESEETPIEVYGTPYALGTPPASPSGQTLRITGYGTTDGVLLPLALNQVQKTHTGPLTSVGGSTLGHQVDTTGGNSGSVILEEAGGTAIGIHTHGGCTTGGGSNAGTSLLHAGLQSALAVPLGVCAGGPPPLRVLLPAPIADPVPPGGASFHVEVVDRDGLPAAITGATLVWNLGGGDLTAPLTSVGGGVWEAALPTASCGGEIAFRVDVTALGGAVVRHPFSAFNSTDRRYRRRVAVAHDTTFRDDFESDQGWTVDDDPGLTDGSWERAVPGGYGLRGDPPWDADASGRAFLTNAAGGNTDVDGGATRLTSPVLDATGPDPHVEYRRWWDDAGASDDVFLVEISDDAGASWTTLETVGPNVVGSWVHRVFRVADFVTPNAQLRVRFTAADGGTGHVIEAAVDGIAVRNTASGVECDVVFADGFESGDTTAWTTSAP